MPAWISEELDRLGDADEIEIAPRRLTGTLHEPVTIWIVRVDDDLYVRSYKGKAGAWYRAAVTSHEGRIRAARVQKDVTLSEESSPDINDQIDAAYRDKYGRSPYLPPMISAQSQETTLKLTPQQP